MKKMSTALAALLVSSLFAVSALAHDYTAGTLEIHHPHSRATPAGAKVGGGYMTITNKGTQDDTLVSASSPNAGTVQFHEMTVENNVMKMREVTGGIRIPAGATVELKPGGLHVMFIGLSEPFKEGTGVKATLVFEKAGPVDVEFKVDSAAGNGAGNSAAESGHGQHMAQ